MDVNAISLRDIKALIIRCINDLSIISLNIKFYFLIDLQKSYLLFESNEQKLLLVGNREMDDVI